MNKAELRANVRHVIAARDSGDPRYFMLLLAMAQRLRAHPDICAHWLNMVASEPDEQPASEPAAGDYNESVTTDSPPT